jgi:hypothetical protein
LDKTINFQNLFEGFQSTALLWTSSPIYELEQFKEIRTNKKFVHNAEHKTLRLGKWVEKFVTFQLQQNSAVKILRENLIVKKEKQTIGELDLLFLKNKNPIHLEIVYKFYLFDTQKKYDDDLRYWIGPNRNDNLIFKINKLKEKQFPLLYHPETQKTLEDYSIETTDFKQLVYFKAQLFLPFDNLEIDVHPLNSECITGWYLNYDRFEELKPFQFYIPKKLEWLSTPHNYVDWLSFSEAQIEIETYIESNRSPLCWLKNDTNEFQKCFITWW